MRSDGRDGASSHPAPTTSAAPPRRGSPPPDSRPSAVARGGLHAAEEQVELPEPARSPGRRARARRCRSRARRTRRRPRSALAAPGRRRPPRMPSSITRMIVCRIAERIRFEPALPSTSSGAPSRSDDGRRHHARQPPARRVAVEAERVEILLAEHVVQVHAGAGHDDARARPVRAGHRARPALAVEHRDVGGRPERRAARQEPLDELRVVESLEELGRALGLRPLHRVHDLRDARAGRARASSSASAWASRIPPADGGGFVTTSRPR